MPRLIYIVASHYIQFARSCEIARDRTPCIVCGQRARLGWPRRRVDREQTEDGGREDETRLTSNNGQQQGGGKQRADIGVAKSRFRGSQATEVCSDNSP